MHLLGEVTDFYSEPSLRSVWTSGSRADHSTEHTYHISSYFLRTCLSTACGREAFFTADTQSSSVRRQEAALPGWSACLINNTRGSGHTLRLRSSKCGPQSLSPWHTHTVRSYAHACARTLFQTYGTHEQKRYVSFCHPSFLSLALQWLKNNIQLITAS